MTASTEAVHKIAPDLLRLAVPVTNLRELAGNPRRGQVGAIAKMLDTFGQRLPLVVQADTPAAEERADQTGTVEAGNHTLKAARRLGWTHIAVSFERADDEVRARAYALTENNTHVRGAFDPDALATMAADVAAADPRLLAAASLELAELRAAQAPAPASDAADDDRPEAVAPEEFRSYDEDLDTDFRCPACTYEWSGRAEGSPPPAEPSAARISADLAYLAVPVAGLRPLPGNPRRGDVEAIAGSLAEYGQRRPLVATAEDLGKAHGERAGLVTAGNHTLLAARDVLGWNQVAVVFTGDDTVTAKAFALGHNQASALGTFDQVDLANMVGEVWAADPRLLMAASFDGDELAELSDGAILLPPPPPRSVRYQCPKCDHRWTGDPRRAA